MIRPLWVGKYCLLLLWYHEIIESCNWQVQWAHLYECTQWGRCDVPFPVQHFEATILPPDLETTHIALITRFWELTGAALT